MRPTPVGQRPVETACLPTVVCISDTAPVAGRTMLVSNTNTTTAVFSRLGILTESFGDKGYAHAQPAAAYHTQQRRGSCGDVGVSHTPHTSADFNNLTASRKHDIAATALAVACTTQTIPSYRPRRTLQVANDPQLVDVPFGLLCCSQSDSSER